MIIDKTGREIKPGQIIDVPTLSLTGAMIPARDIEVVEPSSLSLPQSVTKNPPFVGVMITLQLWVQPTVSRDGSHSPIFVCDNSYIVQQAPPNWGEENKSEGKVKTKLGIIRPN